MILAYKFLIFYLNIDLTIEQKVKAVKMLPALLYMFFTLL